jgi:hypothetical protein
VEQLIPSVSGVLILVYLKTTISKAADLPASNFTESLTGRPAQKHADLPMLLIQATKRLLG